MSRNSEYEKRQKQKGLKKVTLWVPDDKDCDVKQAAQMMCENPELTVSLLRNIRTGRLVSMISK